MSYRLVSVRRYPVKSMGGEDLTTVEFDARGIIGDRWYAVRDADGHLASGKDSRRFRRRDAVFDYQSHTETDAVRVARAGRSWAVGDRELDAHLSERMGTSVSIEPETDVPHQDSGAVSLIGTASLEWCRGHWGINADRCRLRVNLLIETGEPFVEETWIGREVAIGEVTLRPVASIQRCRMIDIDQDGAVAEGKWLKLLGAERDLNLGVYSDVVHAGRVAVDDLLTVGQD